MKSTILEKDAIKKQQPNETKRTKQEKGMGQPKSQQLSDLKIISSLMKYMWPKEWSLRFRVITSFGLLVTSKLLTIQVPILFKYAVDALSIPPDQVVVAVPVALLVGCKYLRNKKHWIQAKLMSKKNSNRWRDQSHSCLI